MLGVVFYVSWKIVDVNNFDDAGKILKLESEEKIQIIINFSIMLISFYVENGY